MGEHEHNLVIGVCDHNNNHQSEEGEHTITFTHEHPGPEQHEHQVDVDVEYDAPMGDDMDWYGIDICIARIAQ